MQPKIRTRCRLAENPGLCNRWRSEASNTAAKDCILQKQLCPRTDLFLLRKAFSRGALLGFVYGSPLNRCIVAAFARTQKTLRNEIEVAGWLFAAALSTRLVRGHSSPRSQCESSRFWLGFYQHSRRDRLSWPASSTRRGPRAQRPRLRLRRKSFRPGWLAP